jgi:hypothetical protein
MESRFWYRTGRGKRHESIRYPEAIAFANTIRVTSRTQTKEELQ